MKWNALHHAMTRCGVAHTDLTSSAAADDMETSVTCPSTGSFVCNSYANVYSYKCLCDGLVER